MPARTHQYHPTSGNALLFAIIGITLLGLLGMGLVSILSGTIRIVGESLPQAGYLAESGITILHSRLRGLSAAAQMREIETLHGNRLIIASSPSDDAPPLGSVVLRLYPHWFQLGTVHASRLPTHAGGCPSMTDTEHAFAAFLPDGTITRFTLQGSGKGSGEGTLAALPPLPNAILCFVGRFQAASLADTTLILTTSTPDDFLPFPSTNGHLSLIDASGTLSPKRFIYSHLRRIDHQILLDGFRPETSTLNQGVSAEPPVLEALSGKHFVLEPHLTGEVLAVTPSGARDVIRFSGSHDTMLVGP